MTGIASLCFMVQRSYSIIFALIFAIRVFAHSPFASTECHQILAQFEKRVESYLQQNEKEYVALKQRVLNDPKITLETFNLFVLKLVHTFVSFEDRIRNSNRFDGDQVASMFLRGVTIWIEDYDDLVQAVEIFYHFNPYHAGSAALDPDADLDLEYFAARMAWLVDQYDTAGDRETALEKLENFDDTNAKELNIIHDHSTGRVTIDHASPAVVTRLTQFGLRPPTIPLTSFKLEFNNRRRFHFFDLRANKKADLWVAQQLARSEPKEWLLGLGDQSVRQFFRIIRITEGYVNRFPFAADFLVLEEDAAPGSYYFKLRELKFSDPGAPNVDIQKALDQLQSSWEGLHDAFGMNVPVRHLEIIVPEREARLRGSLGYGYRIGNRVRGSLHQLMKNGAPVTIMRSHNVPHETLPVCIRQIPITAADFRRLSK